MNCKEIFGNWDEEQYTDWYAVDSLRVGGERVEFARLMVGTYAEAAAFAADRVKGVGLVDYDGSPCAPGEFGDAPFFRLTLLAPDDARKFFEAMAMEIGE